MEMGEAKRAASNNVSLQRDEVILKKNG